MAQILAGTRDGLHRFDASGNALGVEHAGREVTTIAPEGWELWAILDGKEVVHTAGVDWWFHVANLSGLRGNCVADTRAGVILGTSEAHLYRIAGKGVEMVVTLGTGFGTGLYLDGRLGPHLEIAHHPFRHGETYDEQLGNVARKAIGSVRWNNRVKKAIGNMRRLTTFDHLFIGGGNAKKIEFAFEPDVSVVSNEAGLKGGVALWRQ